MDCHDWNLTLMLNLLRFDRRSEPTKLETPCFWYQFLVSGVQNLDTSFWWPVSGTRNVGGELGSCAMGLAVFFAKVS